MRTFELRRQIKNGEPEIIDRGGREQMILAKKKYLSSMQNTDNDILVWMTVEIDNKSNNKVRRVGHE